MPTILDVARAAGVSPATVSRVINHPDIVAADKRDRVRSAIAELGFEPSAPARHLRMGASQSIALLVGDISQPFHGRLAKAVGRASESAGLSVMLGDLDHREDRLIAFLHSAPKRGLAGVIVSTADDLDQPSLRRAVGELVQAGIPMVTTSQGLESLEVPSVTFDYTGVGRDAVEHLVASGRDRIVMLGGGRGSWYSREIQRGVRAAARSGAAQVSVINGRFRHEPARAAIDRLLGKGTRPDGIVAANTPMALGAIRAYADAGLWVPDDVAVVVCENIPESDYLLPSLTTVDADLDSLGTHAVEMLLQCIAGTAPDNPRLLLPHGIVVRESSAQRGTAPQAARSRGESA
jgi:DNA-binding LacI/PurR family transcriptional regulator